jgi:2-keto-3-deoxy-L-rhamnonate aldolase RhmA
VTPLVRIPSNGGEMDQWQAKQALDRGVYGIITPRQNRGAGLQRGGCLSLCKAQKCTSV